MACYVTKDPDNTWPLVIDWSDWFAGLIDQIGGTFTITVSAWFPDTAITEAGKSFDDTNKKTYLYGSGGTAGTTYNVLNRISYTSSELSGQTFTEDRTIQVKIKEK